MGFAILNTKTEYSFLDSAVRLEDYLDTALRLGYEVVGICDIENLHAVFRFIKMAQDRGLRPVVGFETVFLLENVPVQLTFLALNTQGYHNLLKLSTRRNEGNNEFLDLLDGLAVISPAIYESVTHELSKLTENFYIGLGMEDVEVNIDKTIAFPSVRYLSAEDNETLQILHAVRDGNVIDESLILDNTESLQRPEIYEKYYSEHAPEALAKLMQLVQDIHYDLEDELELPSFDKEYDAIELLRKTTEVGIHRLVGDLPIYQERLDHELSIIHQMGFDNYFLIVGDVLRYARESGIYCGMGRGSAAGSLVAYALQITHIDPVKNNLLFERFLNPERIAMPDIDIDMPDDCRGELLGYMRNRYGSDHVAQIVTFSTFGKRQALRDVGKAFGLMEVEISHLTQLMVHRFGTLSQEYEQNQRFRAEILRNSQWQRIYDYAKKIEGMPRQTSIHASGVVLSERPLYDYLPLKPGDDLSLAQFEAPDVEAIGLLKIDFLGLRNLTLIKQFRELVKKLHHIDIDPLRINLEDEETLALFREGNTMGIFQFENPQMRRFLINLLPTKFDDIVNATSIFRPGPSQFIPQFIARRHGKEKIDIIDDSITDILASTYGIMIYQEQVMLVAVRFAGFSMGRADSLRRAISKKKGSEFEKLKDEFISGAISQGHSHSKAEQLYNLIERFANYGFNRSHAYAYAALAFQIGYFKAHYPDEFYEVHLRGHKREALLIDALENDYIIEVPEINKIPYYDKVFNKKITLGLSHIVGFPRDYALWIIENRPFADLSDFVKRTPIQWQREDFIRSLVLIGAFDKFDLNRGKLSANLAALIDYNQTFQLDLFKKTTLKFSYTDVADLSTQEKYDVERQMLGVAITSHPIKDWEKKLSNSFTKLSALTNRQQATILIEITNIRALTTRKNERMAFVETTDSRKKLTVVLFPDAYRANLAKLEVHKLYLVMGRTELREENLQLQATRFIELYPTDEKLWLSINSDEKNNQLVAVLQRFPGPHPVVLHNEVTKETRQSRFYVEKSELLLKQLVTLTERSMYR